MKTTTVAFVLHGSIYDFYETAKKLRTVFSRLIEEENAETFLFSGQSCFDLFCCEVLNDLKRYYPLINRVYVRQLHERTVEFDKKSILCNYDSVYYPLNFNDKSLNKSRYFTIVDKCDVLITYYEKDYTLLKGRSVATKKAIEYALKANKRIINLAEELAKL